MDTTQLEKIVQIVTRELQLALDGQENNQNLKLMHEMVVALNSHDVEAHDQYWAKDMVWHGPPGIGDVHGLEAFKNQVVRPFYAAFPDFHGTIDIELAQGDWVAATGFVTGTHLGEWLGIPPTGNEVKMRYSDFWLFKDGLITENWVMVDEVDVLRQLGADPLAHVHL